MFESLINKINALGSHHQVIFTVIITLSLICISWAIGKILDEHVFIRKHLRGYVLVIIICALLLWITQHLILHVI